MEYTVSATDALTEVTHRTPKKLQTAARSTASRKGRAPVTTTPAIAFGASVQPLTNRTARVSKTVTDRAEFLVSCPRNSKKDRGMDNTSMPQTMRRLSLLAQMHKGDRQPFALIFFGWMTSILSINPPWWWGVALLTGVTWSGGGGNGAWAIFSSDQI